MSRGIVRIGTDLVSIERLGRALRKVPKLLDVAFTNSELHAARTLRGKRRAEFLGGRFAVKEATLKALRCGIQGKDYLRFVETIARPDGSPSVKLHGPIAAKAAALDLSRFEVSISHERDLVIAFVTLV